MSVFHIPFFKESLTCEQLQVSQANIWEYFLDGEHRFGWNVVRLKVKISDTYI
jgi:hypothetical protein